MPWISAGRGKLSGAKHAFSTCTLGDCLALAAGTKIAAVLKSLPKVIESSAQKRSKQPIQESPAKMRIGRQTSFLLHHATFLQEVVLNCLIGASKFRAGLVC